MAFTKINAAGIGTTETVTVDGLTVINDGSFGGNLTVSGVLTYEDVTNVDSVGLITARNGIVVGSGITLSKDGDIFATGITTVSGNVKVGTGITLSPDGDVFFTGVGTGNGSGLTALNASNLGSGTVPTARLGSGTASSSTFLRGDSTFQTVSTDLVDDTSPQLGGGLESNGFNINFADSSGTNNMAKFGASGDLQIYHDSVHSRIVDTGTGDLKLQSSKVTIGNAGNSETMATFDGNGAVTLYHDNTKMFETRSGVSAFENGDLYLDSDSHKLKLGLGADLNIYHNGSHSYIDNDTGTLYLQTATNLSFMTNNNEDAIQCIANGAVSLFYDNSKKFETLTDGVKTSGDLTVNNANKLYLENDSENKTSYLFNSAASTHADITFYTAETGGTAGNRSQITKSGHFIPTTNNTYDIGYTSTRVRNIYTADLHCSNKGSSNDVDGTWGDYTIQEGESDLFLINNRSGKKYKFNLTEVS